MIISTTFNTAHFHFHVPWYQCCNLIWWSWSHHSVQQQQEPTDLHHHYHREQQALCYYITTPSIMYHFASPPRSFDSTWAGSTANHFATYSDHKGVIASLKFAWIEYIITSHQPNCYDNHHCYCHHHPPTHTHTHTYVSILIIIIIIW